MREENCSILKFMCCIFIDSPNVHLTLQVTTVQLSNTTDRGLANTGLRQDFPNGTLLRTFEQQQDKGTTTESNFRVFFLVMKTLRERKWLNVFRFATLPTLARAL